MSGDMERLGETVENELKAAETEEGSYLPRFLVDAQAELVQLGPSEIAKRFADLAIASALIGFAPTPRAALEKLLETYKISDESWYEKVGPELRRVLHARGVEFQVLS